MGFQTLPAVPSAPDAAPGDAKDFVVTNRSYIEVPGLKSLSGISIDGVDMPLSEVRKIRRQPKHTGDPGGHDEVTEELFRLTALSDGTPVIQRNEVTAFGLFKAGSTVRVRGDWE